MQDIYILGINGTKRASAALIKNGEIIAACLEERFTRLKNQSGYPKNAIDYCLKEANIKSSKLTEVWIGFLNPALFIKENDAKVSFGVFSKLKPYFTKLSTYLIAHFPNLNTLYKLREKTYVWKLLGLQQKNYLSYKLKVSPKIIHQLDHHRAHAYAAYYTNPQYPKVWSKKSLVLTLDGAGDQVCSRIFVVKKDYWQEIANTSNDYSLGELYYDVTEFLGFKPNEDEHKVMGLAGYADPSPRINTIFKKLIWVEGLRLKSSVKRASYFNYLTHHLSKSRFDQIASGIQNLTEEIIIKLIKNAIKKTGIHNIILGGGVFMNIKANMKLLELPEIENLYACPSSTDDSTALGAAYYGYQSYCKKNKIPFNPKPPAHLYLGPAFSFSPKKISAVKIKKLTQPAKQIANLLAKGKIVAYFSGRMEYGARALGNRSILANPSQIELGKIINDQVKDRDFWMPFAPTILQEKQSLYIINLKKINSPYMMVAFPTTKQGQEDLAAAIHPYDLSTRPQILSLEHNPAFYQIIDEFGKLTGIYAVLNTSFNLHGQPIVCAPEDALKTFINSGLNYLVLENYLLVKTDKN